MARLYLDAVNDGSIANEGGVIILLCMIVMSEAAALFNSHLLFLSVSITF